MSGITAAWLADQFGLPLPARLEGPVDRGYQGQVTAYREAGGPARPTKVGDFTMPIAVFHHLVELAAGQWLTATDDEARQVAEGRVREFTDDPFGLDQIHEILDAIH
ncbi:MAG: hypothetical protein QM650_17785 [Microlunatus sp.]